MQEQPRPSPGDDSADARRPEHEARRQFEEEVFPAELDYIEDRRRSVGDRRAGTLEGRALGTGNDLTGLALSGGGIRSASFSLGFLQALGVKLFRRIDYLSTVSGGGFIGSSITALMANAFYRGKPAAFPFPLTRSEQEPAPLSHLRNNSNYMAPGGLGDIFRLLAVLLRGIILNSLSLLPFLLLVCLVVLLMYGQQLSDRSRFDDQVRQIDGLLERYSGDWLQSETARELDPLLAVLEAEALLRIDEGKSRGDVVAQLRPALSLRRGTERDLITGNGTEDSPYRLTPEASREDFARALLAGDVLQPNEVIEEIDLLARILEQNGYRHPEPDAEEPLASSSVDMLLTAAHELDLIRPGTRKRALDDFLGGHHDRRLKPVLQALYNGEYLNEEVVRRLVREERDRRRREQVSDELDPRWRERVGAWLDRLRPQQARNLERPAYYAYGWYEARIGQAFAGSWYTSHPWPPIAARVRAELRRLTPAFAEDCLPGTGEMDVVFWRGYHPPRCLRPGTTLDDLRRLLVFKELVDESESFDDAMVALRREYLEDRAPAPGAPAEDGRLGDVVEALYFGEYLREEWVREKLAGDPSNEPRRLAEHLVSQGFRSCPLPEIPQCCAPPDFEFRKSPDCLVKRLPSSRKELLGRLVLAEETIPDDLQEILEETRQPAQGLGEARLLSDVVDGWKPLETPDVAELEQVLAVLRETLDDAWVRRLLYVYSYGWHRTLLGQTYPGNWCANAEGRDRSGGRGGPIPPAAGEGCLESTEEAWRELSRALRDPSRWDPNRLRLPFTWVTIRLALGWVLLFPLVLIVARRIYRRHQRAVAREPNPLRALLSSDQALNWRDLYERTFGALLMVILGIALIELLPYAVHHFHYLNLRGQSSRTLAVGAVSLLVTALGGPALALLQRFGRLVALALLAVAGPLLLLTLFVSAMEIAVYPPPQAGGAIQLFADQLLWFEEGGRRLLDPAAAWMLFAIVSAAAIVLALVIDINATSLHGLYRDRIAKAFMVGLDTEGTIEPEEDLPLHQICPAGSGAPYHLINVALNLQGSSDRSLRGRDCDFLFFSRDHVGGPRTGYCRTRDLGWVFPYAHLASAMAVSAAAVSPNMGRYKSGPLAVLLSLLNTRLAVWIPHPGAVRRWFAGRGDSAPGPQHARGRLLDLWRRMRLRAPATLLLRELAGAVDDRGPVVNVSDGGHIENTGALELLRRRCKKIIIVDGEADPHMAFGGLAQLQRIARIGMGIEIEIDGLAELRPDENGLSRRRSAVGTIRYPARRRGGEGQELVEETGRLLYVKLAVTGAEDETVAEYRARYAAFPHQSTGDQSFDESQLEAYRQLGQLAGRELLETAGDALAESPVEADPQR